ncbi:YceI family protein [Neptuniibacter sp. PT8_73]|uniref:YceI family protein n=1 Tax=unclassified Neptuniibacter TaxID=2630693 RepID=UPI0039F721FB
MKKLVAIASLALFSTVASADWTLSQQDSDFSFSSIKKAKVLENHSFKQFSGGIDAAGKATLTLDLASVTTGIEIRDERMQNMLFETGKFAQANFTAQVDVNQIEKQAVGSIQPQTITGKLSLHGVEKEITAQVNVVKLADNKVLVSTAQPITINAADFALDSGVTALKEIAKLPSISFAVPVSFNLAFTK